jgi:hypothetical protein
VRVKVNAFAYSSPCIYRIHVAASMHCKKKGRIINEKWVLDTVINGKKV